MPLGLKNNIINQKGTPAFYSDIFANRPTYGYAGRVFISTDTGAIYEDTGTAWTLIADAGAGTTGTLEQVTTNGNTTTKGLVVTAGNVAIGTATAGAPLDVHFSTNIGIQINNTATGNSNIAFQNQDIGKWRIGNVYNGGANSFDVYNNTLLTTALSFNATNNAATFNNSVTATSHITSGGSSTQFVKGDGSLDSTQWVPLSNGSNISPQLINSTAQYLGQVASNDNWKIFGYWTVADQMELVFQVGDNGFPYASSGERFRFSYDASTTGTNKDVLIIDYNTIYANTNFLILNSTDNGNALQVTGNATLGTKLLMSTSAYVMTSGNNATSLAALTTGDIYLFRNNAGTIVGQNYISGILSVQVIGGSGGTNQFEACYTLLSAGNGTTNAVLTSIGTNIRGTNPITAITLANDGGAGGIKIQATTIAGLSGANFTVSFMGTIS